MSKNSGYLVKTKTGKVGRTYHKDKLINKKTVVYIEENGETLKMLCDQTTIEIIGFID
jgi:hypothetical protein